MFGLLCSEGHPEGMLCFTNPTATTATSRYGKIQTYSKYLTYLTRLFL